MDDRRDPSAEPGSRPREPIADGKLSPVQKAQERRRVHAEHCRQCADIDRPLCAEGEKLLQDWNQAMNTAYEQLHGSR